LISGCSSAKVQVRVEIPEKLIECGGDVRTETIVQSSKDSTASAMNADTFLGEDGVDGRNCENNQSIMYPPPTHTLLLPNNSIENSITDSSVLSLQKVRESKTTTVESDGVEIEASSVEEPESKLNASVDNLVIKHNNDQVDSEHCILNFSNSSQVQDSHAAEEDQSQLESLKIARDDMDTSDSSVNVSDKENAVTSDYGTNPIVTTNSADTTSPVTASPECPIEENAQEVDYSCVTYICNTAHNDEFILDQISSSYNSCEYTFISIRHGIHPFHRNDGTRIQCRTP
jgi:hypothetical protein